ncbi:MAG: hypothetical protein HY040_22775 [Planctomycetes bacterium]|nr:hypothetical protein [Planctomycetota bacterium]
MLRLFRNWPLLAILTGIVVLAEPPPAKADFQIRISDGTTTQVFTDNNAGDLNGQIGAMNIVTSVGNFNVVMALGVSKPVVGNSSLAVIDLSSLSVSTVGGGTLRIDITDTSFTIPPGANQTAFLSSQITGNVFGGSIGYQSWVDYSNTAFGGADSSPGPVFSTGLQANNTTANMLVSGFNGGPFSLTSETVISLGGGGFASADGTTSLVTPAPSTLGAALIALPILGLVGWQRRRNAKAA